MCHNVMCQQPPVHAIDTHVQLEFISGEMRTQIYQKLRDALPLECH